MGNRLLLPAREPADSCAPIRREDEHRESDCLILPGGHDATAHRLLSISLAQIGWPSGSCHFATILLWSGGLKRG